MDIILLLEQNYSMTLFFYVLVSTYPPPSPKPCDRGFIYHFYQPVFQLKLKIALFVPLFFELATGVEEENPLRF